MTKSLPSSVTIVCEDLQHSAFVYRYLLRLGFSPHQIVREVCRQGSEAAEAWVRDSYPDQIRRLRRKSSRALIVVIDADQNSIAFRHAQLETELKLHNLSKRSGDDCVAILIPKRNIETWIHFLIGRPVDEETPYPKLDQQRHCQPAVDRLHTIRLQNWTLPDGHPPSLGAALPELQRIEQ